MNTALVYVQSRSFNLGNSEWTRTAVIISCPRCMISLVQPCYPCPKVFEIHPNCTLVLKSVWNWLHNSISVKPTHLVQDLSAFCYDDYTHNLYRVLYVYDWNCTAVIIWWFRDVLTSGSSRTNWRLTQFIELIQPLIGFVAFPRSPNQLDYVIISSVQFSCNNLI